MPRKGGPLLDEILFDALQRQGGERERFVAAACAGDAQLRAEVESLLAAHARAAGFLETGPAKAPRTPSAAPESWLGQSLGAYRIARVIGAGGMGTVLLGERADQQFRKQVAIKVIRPGMASDDVLRRFGTERQLLAQLGHPNIARLLDAGVTDLGLPYLVMDYVEGVPIDRYCEDNRMSVRERLTLFRKVCEPVHYAHQRLVVHRDLKPGNILIDADGEPKLLDFGIAKVLDPTAATALAAETTLPALRLLTPRYASPEQLCGQPVTTASDVYSLGVILYELLTGLRPFEFEPHASLEHQHDARQRDPTRPSTAVRPASRTRGAAPSRPAPPEADTRRLSRQLSGDVDNIVLMALRSEPQRRYASVAELAQDIGRHLEGLPVSARPNTLRYRLSRFVRRNAVAVGAAGVLALGLLAATALSTTLYLRSETARVAAEQAKRQAQSERDRADRDVIKQRAVRVFLTQLLGDLRPPAADAPSLSIAEALDRRMDNRSRTPVQLDSDVRAALHVAAGELYRWLERPEQAVREYEAALELLEAGPPSWDLAEALQMLGQSRFAQGRHADAITLFERSLEVQQRANIEPTRGIVARLGLVESLVAAGRLDEAEQHLDQTGAIPSRFYRNVAEQARTAIEQRRSGSAP